MKLKSPKAEILNYVKHLEARVPKVFMLDSMDEEKRYALHNMDRYINVIKELDKIIPRVKKPITVLDIGTSPLTFVMRRRYPSLKISSVDYASQLSPVCKKLGIKFKRVDLNKRNFKLPSKKFNIILFLEVIEHLSGDHYHIMKNILRYLKKNSYCIVQTPNRNSLKSLIVKILTLNRVDDISQRPDLSCEFEHVKEYSFEELKSFLMSFPGLYLLKAEYSLYFDTVGSSVVYRRYSTLVKPILFLLYAIVFAIPSLRRGLLFVVQKKI